MDFYFGDCMHKVVLIFASINYLKSQRSSHVSCKQHVSLKYFLRLTILLPGKNYSILVEFVQYQRLCKAADLILCFPEIIPDMHNPQNA